MRNDDQPQPAEQEIFDFINALPVDVPFDPTVVSALAYYAHERKHSSLDRQTPAEVYRSGRSTRVGPSIYENFSRSPKIGVHFKVSGTV